MPLETLDNENCNTAVKPTCSEVLFHWDMNIENNTYILKNTSYHILVNCIAQWPKSAQNTVWVKEALRQMEICLEPCLPKLHHNYSLINNLLVATLKAKICDTSWYICLKWRYMYLTFCSQQRMVSTPLSKNFTKLFQRDIGKLLMFKGYRLSPALA